jgi:hypothetical protein
MFSRSLLTTGLRWKLGVSTALLLLFGVNFGLHAADLKPEQRLEAIRNALVEAAEKSNVRVSSSSWMDTHGALLQLNRFSSEIKLRDLQIDQYKKTSTTETVELSKKTTETIAPLRCDAPQARSPMKHVMRVSLDIASSIPPSQQFLAQKIGIAARQQAMRAATESRHWRLTTESTYNRTYERLYNGMGEEAMPWQLQQEATQWRLQLSVMPARYNLNTADYPAFVLLWQAQYSPNGSVWFDAQNTVFGVTIPSAYGTPKLDIDTTLAIESNVAQMARDLDRQLACDPQSFAVQQNSDGQLVLLAGRNSGLRVGDQIVLADARVLPGRAIEAGALDAVVLVEVKSVSAYQAEIRQVAGRKQTFQGGWVAWPYIY